MAGGSCEHRHGWESGELPVGTRAAGGRGGPSAHTAMWTVLQTLLAGVRKAMPPHRTLVLAASIPLEWPRSPSLSRGAAVRALPAERGFQGARSPRCHHSEDRLRAWAT